MILLLRDMRSLFLILAVILAKTSGSEKLVHREKRYILFPYRGTFKLVLGFAIPVKVGPKQELGIGWNFQFQYALPYNTTVVQSYPPVVSRSREKREDDEENFSDRALLYKGIENLLEREGYRGNDCLLRSICENAVDSLYHDANGLYGQILHIILTPDYGDGQIDPELDPVYLDAQRAGEYGVDCESLYTRCDMDGGLLNLFSLVDNEIL